MGQRLLVPFDYNGGTGNEIPENCQRWYRTVVRGLRVRFVEFQIVGEEVHDDGWPIHWLESSWLEYDGPNVLDLRTEEGQKGIEAVLLQVKERAARNAEEILATGKMTCRNIMKSLAPLGWNKNLN